MLNRYQWWKNLIVVAVLLVGAFYAVPNLFGEDPAVQISQQRGAELGEEELRKVQAALDRGGVAVKALEMSESRLLVRFASADEQLQAATLIKESLGPRYTVALNLASSTPNWLESLNALPMNLGLDLRGGVHFLLEVDMDAVAAQSAERYSGDVRTLLRRAGIRYQAIEPTASGGVEIRLRDVADADETQQIVGNEYAALEMDFDEATATVSAVPTEDELDQSRRLALQQNITTLRNRVNELGVAEPLVQQQGLDRIVVQLPGVQDTTRAKEILGATATLEFRLVDEDRDAREAQATGRVPASARLYFERSGAPILLKRQVMLTGDYITDAASGIDTQSGGPAVFITLDGRGARRMSDATKDNVGRLMAVVFIENQTETRRVGDEFEKITTKVEEVINVARIRERLSARFQITGLDSTTEARDLALLLRAGALAAPVEIVEERTVGPSMGQENIDQGFLAVVIGFALVLVFMAIYYRVFGLVADLALAANLVLIVSVLSMLQATLTLPGIAGIVLTVGMAVDANVLIFERIREELRNGLTPQAAINAGYRKALSTIADANITTLIAAVVLFGFGTGPIKGFAVTLSIGIVTSMFTAIMGTRAVINLIYGGRRIPSLAI